MIVSVLVHALCVGLLLVPFAVHNVIVEQEQGAGGPGPAGGGGGGHGGTGGRIAEQTERLQFVLSAPPPPEPVPPQQVVPPPVVTPPEPVKIEPTPAVQLPAATKLPEVAAIPGIGGGTGRDGTNGSGPGSGGGVGTGIGTGRGSGVGPGTGGGTQENYPPTPTELYLPPLPAPSSVRGFHFIAEFDVDERGRVLSFDFTRSKDRDYNKKLEESLRNMRFRPGMRPDGTPIRMKAQIGYEF